MTGKLKYLNIQRQATICLRVAGGGSRSRNNTKIEGKT